jgi:hypothetical protein
VDPENRSHLAELEDYDEDQKTKLLEHFDNLASGLVFVQPIDSSAYVKNAIGNLFLSKCYNCKKIAVWVHDRMVFPAERASIAPNLDLPEDMVADFNEAREIVNASPRGAAALLRLVVQKLCSHLGANGNTIDQQIADLVGKGLNPLVQKSLDVVRVIGNDAVHPGSIDLKDDRDTALNLFRLVNAIAEQMISHPKSVNDMYAMLPEGKRNAIEARNEKAKKGN